MKDPLVSIVTPVYNTGNFLSATIESVLSQHFQNWELLLVDDASTDESNRIIESYTNEPRIKLTKLRSNHGPGFARNTAIEQAKGKYIAFLDSDDIWSPEKLQLHVVFMEKGHYTFSHTSYGYLDEEGIKKNHILRVSSNPIAYRDLLRRTEISCLTAMYNQEELGKMFMPELRRKQDFALWLAILKRGVLSYPLDKVLAYYRERKGSITNNKIDLIASHYAFLRKHERISAINSLKYTFFWGLNGIRKYYIKK